jgi:hypothetical protein
MIEIIIGVIAAFFILAGLIVVAAIGYDED